MKINNVLLWIVTSAFLVAGCSKQNETKPPSTLVVGCVLPLTGEVAKYGEDARNGITLAIEQLDGTGRDLRIEFADSKAEPKTGLTAYQQLRVQKHINVCLSLISGVSKAIAPAAARDDVFHFATVAAAPDIFPAGAPAYRWYYTGDLLAIKMAELIRANPQRRSISVIAEQIEYSAAAAAVLQQQLTGDRQVALEFYDGKSLVARDLAVKVVASRPDIVVLLGSGGRPAANLLTSLREAGFNGAILGDDSVSFPEVLDASAGAADGVAFVASSFNPEDRSNPFTAAYYKRFGKSPSDISAFAYDMVRIMASCPEPRTTAAIQAHVTALRGYRSALGLVDAIPEKKQLSVSLQLRIIRRNSTGAREIVPVDSLP